jgi:hypothetical protein
MTGTLSEHLPGRNHVCLHFWQGASGGNWLELDDLYIRRPRLPLKTILREAKGSQMNYSGAGVDRQRADIENGRKKLLWWQPSLAGLYFGALFCVATFWPSLLPRPWVFQGVLSGLVFALGYGTGTVGLWNCRCCR